MVGEAKEAAMEEVGTEGVKEEIGSPAPETKAWYEAHCNTGQTF